jgi:hypothetical protein
MKSSLEKALIEVWRQALVENVTDQGHAARIILQNGQIRVEPR